MLVEKESAPMSIAFLTARQVRKVFGAIAATGLTLP